MNEPMPELFADKSIATRIAELISVDEAEATAIIEKAIAGRETTSAGLESWYTERFLPNVVFIDEDGYARMCIDALKILGTTAATDFGSSRQRDLGQLWADMIRGYLGELAVKLFFAKKGIEIELGHEQGVLTDYLPSDIHKVKKAGEDARPPKVLVGIKTTKWNGIWLDIAGDQFSHSDIHVLVKVGTGRDHLFAYFKKISVFRDKILRIGQDIGLLSEGEADGLYDNLPTFRPIAAYIAGFARKDDTFGALPYKGKKGQKHYMVFEWNGAILPGDLDRIKAKEGIGSSGNVKFEGIGEFNHDKGYLFNAGKLRWNEHDWQKVFDAI